MIEKSISNIIADAIHNGSVNRKSLIKVGELKGEIQTLNYAWLTKDMRLEEHSHSDCSECFLFIEGCGEMTINDKILNVSKDDFVIVEKNENHSLVNMEDQKLVFITIRVLTE